MLYVSAAIIVLAYILGSVPFGLLVGKVFYRVDIREHGSGNIGATNAYRTLGPVAGLSVFAADFFKAFIPIVAAKILLSSNPELMPTVSVLAGMAAIVGHSYSMFLKFSGGKGMSTAAGLVAALWPWVALILITTWVVLIAVTKYVSLASITIVIMLPILVHLLYPRTEYVVFSILAGIVIIYKHRSNIARLVQGKELKIGQKTSMEED